jgi:hypothetical protein
MRSVFSFGLATLVFVMGMSFCPAAQAWQSGRYTTVSPATTAPLSGAAAVAAVQPSGGASSTTTSPVTAAAKTTAPATTAAKRQSSTPARLGAAVQRFASSAGARVRQHRQSYQAAARLSSSSLAVRHVERRRAPVTPTPSVTPSTPATPAPDPTATSDPAPTPDPLPPLTGSAIAVPSHATKTQIDACVARAVAAGSGSWLVFPAGTFAYAGTFVVPDGINVRGQGIWDQGLADGGGGTWLQCVNGMQWGSGSTIEELLAGKNSAGATCTFHPVARGSDKAGSDTKVNGSHDCTFEFVRFKGGSDSGANLIDLGANFSGTWSSSVKSCDMIDTNWYDCEFERPQVTNATAGTTSGAIMNIWLDCRAGGGRVSGNGWYRCHFGVANGYHSGIDGFGMGRTILFQPAPAEHASDGPRPSGKADDMSFDWSQVDHGFADNHFVDCLFEYSLWYPMDVCDYTRSYSLTNLFHGVIGGNPPTTTQAAAIPASMWNSDLSMTRCYFKGSYPTAHGVVYEIGRDSQVIDSFNGSGSFGIHAGTFGNSVSGSFSNTRRPRTATLTSDWSGGQTAYTPSPFDP